MPNSLPEVVLSPEVQQILKPRMKRELNVPPAAKCPQQVLEMVAWLKSTGTGTSKLQALLDLGCVIKKEGLGSEAFYERAKGLVGEGTLAKVAAYIQAASAVQAPPRVVAERIKEKVEEAKSAKLLEDLEQGGSAKVEENIEEIENIYELHADEAIDKINQMTSVDHLEEIVVLDKRVTVQRAAEGRLKALKS